MLYLLSGADKKSAHWRIGNGTSSELKHRPNPYVVDLEYLKKLLDILGQASVVHFKKDGLELSLICNPKTNSSPSPALQTEQHIPIKEEELPPDLRADTLMNQDTILNWSAPPSANEEPLPLTGDMPL